MSSTKVGFGQNKGNGSPSENQQPVDEKGRYSSEIGNSFASELIDFSNNYFKVFSKEDSIFSKYPSDQKAMENNIFSALSKFYTSSYKPLSDVIVNLAESRLLNVAINNEEKTYCEGSTVYLSPDFVKNNGSPYNSLSEVITHEFGHAVDYAFSSQKPMSLTVDCVVDGEAGTLLDFAEKELGNLDYEFQDMAFAEADYLISKNGIDGVIDAYKKFCFLNDIMSASNAEKEKRGRYLKFFGNGHSNEYFQNDAYRASEIFANIGSILSNGGEAEKWIKEKAPKTIKAYEALMKIAEEKSSSRAEEIRKIKKERGMKTILD